MVMSPQHSDQMSQRSKVSRIAVSGRYESRWVCRKVFFGQVMSPDHSDQMSQVSGTALW